MQKVNSYISQDSKTLTEKGSTEYDNKHKSRTAGKTFICNVKKIYLFLLDTV